MVGPNGLLRRSTTKVPKVPGSTSSRFIDRRGWTIHRQRAWIAPLSGRYYDFIDFSILAGRGRSTEDGRRLLCSRFGALARFWEENRVWSTTIDQEVRAEAPEGCTALSVLDERSPTSARYIYVAGEVPNDLALPFSDRSIEGVLQLSLPPGEYLTYWFAPETAATSDGRRTRSPPGRSCSCQGPLTTSWLYSKGM